MKPLVFLNMLKILIFAGCLDRREFSYVCELIHPGQKPRLGIIYLLLLSFLHSSISKKFPTQCVGKEELKKELTKRYLRTEPNVVKHHCCRTRLCMLDDDTVKRLIHRIERQKRNAYLMIKVR